MAECDGTSDRARPFTNPVAIVAALYNPAITRPSGDDADVVTPYDNGPNLRAACV